MAAYAFNPETHEYTADGVRWPSVTEILKLSKLSFRYPEGDYAERGRWVHWVCHLMDLGLDLSEALESVPETWRTRIACYGVGYAAFLQDIEPEIILSEKILYAPDLELAGTLDRYIKFGCEQGVMDIKTGTLPGTVGMQVAAYDRMLFGNIPDPSDIRRRRWALNLTGDTRKYRLVRCTEHKDYANFLALRSEFKQAA